MSYRRPPPSYGVPALRDSPEYNASGAYRKVTTFLDAHRESVKMTSNDEHAEDGEWAQWPAVEIPTPPVIDKAERYAQDIENALMHKRMEVPREAQFWEGNYDRAIAAVRSILEPLKLWTRANSPPIFIGDVSQEIRFKVQMDCERAIFIIMSYVCGDFADRLGIYRGSHRSDELLKLLKGACRPFRLMDLPEKLRNRIWAYWVEGPEERGPCRRCGMSSDDIGCRACRSHTHRKYEFRYLTDVWPPQVRLLGAISRQVRKEILAMFHSLNKFHLDFWSGEQLEDFEEDGKGIEDDQLNNLRDLTLHMHWRKDYVDVFHMTCSSDGKFKVLLWSTDNYCFDPDLLEAAEAIREKEQSARELEVAVEKRRSSGEWTGTGIIQSLVLEPDLLRRAAWGSPLYIQLDWLPINERNAYQVAYGREVVKNCPW